MDTHFPIRLLGSKLNPDEHRIGELIKRVLEETEDLDSGLRNPQEPATSQALRVSQIMEVLNLRETQQHRGFKIPQSIQLEEPEDAVHAALRAHSFEQLGHLALSLNMWKTAVSLSGSKCPSDWLYEYERIKRACDHIPADKTMPPVERRAAAGLSLASFRHKYSQQQQAVVITGLGPHLVSDQGHAWLLSNVPNKQVGVYKHGTHQSRDSDTDVVFMKIGEYLNHLEASPNDSLYLYDTSIPKSVASLLEHLRIPRYFCHDYRTQCMDSAPWAHNWPSLFVGAKGSSSSLHVDQWHGNFWMVVVSGRKRWVLFHPEDTALLYPSWSRGTLAPAFPSLQELEQNPERYPDFVRARRTEVIVSAGDVLFVPGGTPHFVENLDITIAYAGNYIDESNIETALEDIRVLGLRDPVFKSAFDALNRVEFDQTVGCHDELLSEHQLVVPFEDYVSGVSASWPLNPVLNCSFHQPPSDEKVRVSDEL
eukprot:m.118272 g.118272  ORF g.118272 m.118272 type:complete len:481 (+) comp28649_c0_seq1:167-1609(+)